MWKFSRTAGAVCLGLSMHVNAMTEIGLADGSTAADCVTYEKARSHVQVDQSVMNAMIASEYLTCSKQWGGAPLAAADDLSGLARALRVHQLPTSLGMRATATTTFVALGARYDAATHALTFEEDDQNIAIEFVQRKGDDYLVWVTDEILKGSYRSYYPAIVNWRDGVAKVRSYYASGF